MTRLRTSDGQTISIQTDAFERRAEDSHHNDAAKVGGAAAVGAIIGAIAGGGYVLATQGKDVELPAEAGMKLRLDRPLSIPSADVSGAAAETGAH